MPTWSRGICWRIRRVSRLSFDQGSDSSKRFVALSESEATQSDEIASLRVALNISKVDRFTVASLWKMWQGMSFALRRFALSNFEATTKVKDQQFFPCSWFFILRFQLVLPPQTSMRLSFWTAYFLSSILKRGKWTIVVKYSSLYHLRAIIKSDH